MQLQNNAGTFSICFQVKNIEYSDSENLLVTSAFDGSINLWDIKGDNEINTPNNAFVMNGIMRTKLSPDSEKMVISTTSGYLVIIHDLKLSKLAQDLRSFKVSINLCSLSHLRNILLVSVRFGFSIDK